MGEREKERYMQRERKKKGRDRKRMIHIEGKERNREIERVGRESERDKNIEREEKKKQREEREDDTLREKKERDRDKYNKGKEREKRREVQSPTLDSQGFHLMDIKFLVQEKIKESVQGDRKTNSWGFPLQSTLQVRLYKSSLHIAYLH